MSDFSAERFRAHDALNWIPVSQDETVICAQQLARDVLSLVERLEAAERERDALRGGQVPKREESW